MKEEAQILEMGSPTKTAEYIYAHLQDLTRLARQSEMEMLVYLLEMAQIEALEISKQIRPVR
nr:hypothetical protein [uncultured Cohaesibacter sp.]